MALTTEEILIKIRTEEDGFKQINSELTQLETRLNRMASNPKGNVQNFAWFKDQKQTLENGKVAVQQWEQSLQSTTGSTKLLTSANLGMLASYVGISGGIAGAIALIKNSISAYIQQEKAIMSLNFALGKNAEATARLTERAAELQDKSIYGDELIIQAEAFLALQGRTEEQINKVISAAIDLSAVTGKDLMTSVKELDQTYEGSVLTLGRLDNRLRDLSEEQLKNGDAITIIAKKYKGLGEEVGNTDAGKIEKAKNLWSDFTEELGKFAVLGDPIRRATQGWAKEFADLGETLVNNTLWLTGLHKEAEKPIKVQIDVETNISDLTKNVWSVLFGQDLRHVGKTKDIQAGKGTPSKLTTKTDKTGSSPKEIKEEELRLLVIEQEKLDKLKIKLDANLGVLGAELEIRKEILEVVKRMMFLEEGMWKTGATPLKFNEDILKGMEISPRGEPIQDPEARQRFEDAMAEYQEEMNDLMISAFGESLDIASQISTIFGGAADEIINAFRTAYSLANSIASFISSIISIIGMFTPAGAVGALTRAGGGDVVAGTLYRVNENQTEYFKSNVSGTIIPLMANQGSQNIQIEPVNVSIKGEDIAIVFGRVEGKKNNYVGNAYAG